MSTCTTTLLNLPGAAATDQITRGLTQPWDNTVAKSTRLAATNTTDAINTVTEGMDDTDDRTGGLVEDLDMVTDSDANASDAMNATSSKFVNASGDDSTLVAEDNTVVGEIERTGDPAEYSAGKAARSVVSSTLHFVNEFVLGLTGYSLYFWAGLAAVVFLVVFLAKEGYLSRLGFSKSSNMSGADLMRVLQELQNEIDM